MARVARFERKGSVQTAINLGAGWQELQGELFGDYRAGPVIDVPDSPRLSPVDPPAIYCIGLNYREHAKEVGLELPEYPVLFMKSVAALSGHGYHIENPTQAGSNKLDYECELAVVIGRDCKNVSAAEALDYVAGYTCANDVSARDWQMEWGGGQFCRGKTFDTFCPLGPELVTTDEIDNPNALRISTLVNGNRVQESTTADMIFDVPTLIEFLSASCTLLAGSVILTGTPSGVGAGRTPPLWLKAGDSVTIEIEKIGSLENSVIEEKIG
ncbi:MAG: fumarylacetoacetate hydrolase family protein [Gammaproteobacteria bacterium]